MKKLSVGVVLSLVLLAACQVLLPASTSAAVDFLITFHGIKTGEIEIVLEVSSINSVVPADDEFDGQFNLYTADGDILSRAVIKNLPEVVKGESEEMIRIQTSLEMGEYIAVWGAPGYGANVVNLQLEEVGSTSILEPLVIKSMSVDQFPEEFSEISN